MATIDNVNPSVANWIPAVRNAITALGASHYQVLCSVNSVLADMNANGGVKMTTGRMRLKNTKKEYSFNTSVKLGSLKFTTPVVSVQCLFALWHQGLEESNDVYEIPSIELPEVVKAWILSKEGFKLPKEEQKPEEQKA